MTDPSATEADLTRKRTRSSSPILEGSDSPSSVKKVQLSSSASAFVPRPKDNSSTPSQPPKESDAPAAGQTVTSSSSRSANKATDARVTMDDDKPMVLDEDVESMPAVGEAAAQPPLEEDNGAAAMAVDEKGGVSSLSPPVGGAEGEGEAQSAAIISVRCLIVTQDASIIIGKAGKHVNEIREKSGSRVTISENVPGNPERILLVSGPLDAVSKAFGLIVRRINDEPFDVPSIPGSKAVTIRFIVPNQRMGSIIGRAGAKIKEIQEASGARLNATEQMLPGSNDRILSVSGVADAIHIAVYYIGTILLENPVPASHHAQYRPAGGQGYYPGPHPQAVAAAPGSRTQSIFIPQNLVGSIIGKGGQKINEIRAVSQCIIRICEPGEQSVGGGANNSERLVTITGQETNIQMAVGLLYQRLEQEKSKQQLMASQGH